MHSAGMTSTPLYIIDMLSKSNQIAIRVRGDCLPVSVYQILNILSLKKFPSYLSRIFLPGLRVANQLSYTISMRDHFKDPYSWEVSRAENIPSVIDANMVSKKLIFLANQLASHFMPNFIPRRVILIV